MVRIVSLKNPNKVKFVTEKIAQDSVQLQKYGWMVDELAGPGIPFSASDHEANAKRSYNRKSK